MSVRTSSSQVQSISGTSALALGEGVALAAVAVVAAAWALGKLGHEAFRACQAVSAAVNESTLVPACQLTGLIEAEQKRTQRQLSSQAIPTVEAAKVATLASLASAPIFIEEGAVRQPLTALAQAKTVVEVERARNKLLGAVRVSHHTIFVRSLTEACMQASKQVGLETVHVSEAPSGRIRVVAEDQRGRALVTEITARPDAAPNIESEVVGVSDNSCVALMDAFDRALEQQGVRVAPRRRKSTGGIAELAAAREFLRRKPPVKGAGQAAGESERSDARRRRLNARRQNVIRGR